NPDLTESQRAIQKDLIELRKSKNEDESVTLLEEVEDLCYFSLVKKCKLTSGGVYHQTSDHQHWSINPVGQNL
ncbi:hypothetical protein BpHYR1_040332, partial [Brachionus plicatilis]